MIPGLPRWSPDGKQIAFVGAMPGERFKAYVISAEGGSAEPIPSQESVQADPTWSPDGNSIIFWRRAAWPAGSDAHQRVSHC
jgi:Tol biopolymer transport system component